MSNNMSLYVHIPFCKRKCNYCDFLSFPCEQNVKDVYLNRLISEIYEQGEKYKNCSVDTIFFGGGTPSLLTEEWLVKIMCAIRQAFTIIDNAEISIEVNPGTVSFNKLVTMMKCGFNRLSIGLQSTNSQELKILGRIHDYDEFLDCYEQARRAGFQNINIDLMLGLPGQTINSLEVSLQQILKLQPEHISVYSLIIEEGTPFYDRYENIEDMIPSEEEERTMYYLVRDKLAEQGYHQYEISNYAKDKYECKHNVGYWTGHNYLGLGLGASSMINFTRWKNSESLEEYLKTGAIKEYNELSYEEQMEEYMFLGLRMNKGISVQAFQDRFGVSIYAKYEDWLNKMTAENLLVIDDYVYLTHRGMDLANYVMSGFLFG